MNRTLPHPTSAFTLVEVTIALGLASFCLVAMLGLLPAGLNANRDGIEQTMGTGIAAAVAADLRTSAVTGPRFGFTDSTAMQTRFLAEDGSISASIVTSGASTSRYRVSIVRGAASTTAACPVRILVSWPAQADPNPAQLPTKQIGSVDIVTALSPG